MAEGMDAEAIVDMMREEFDELQDALMECFLTGDVFTFASEVGDILYLALMLCESVGLKAEEVVTMKLFRNDYKHTVFNYSNHRDMKDAAKVSREAWKYFGGDSAFSHAYLDVLAHD